MFRDLAVGKIMAVVENFGRNFGRELDRIQAKPEIRSQLAIMLNNTLEATATDQGTETARKVVARAKPLINQWLGADQ